MYSKTDPETSSREKQDILIITDNFSTYNNAKLVKSEKADNLRGGLIILTSSIRHSGPITVRTDCAPGFISPSQTTISSCRNSKSQSLIMKL